MPIRYFSVKSSLATITQHDPTLIAYINGIVKDMSQVRTEGMLIFGFYIRRLFSRNEFSESSELHATVSSNAEVFPAETRTENREWRRIIRQCLAFAAGSNRPCNMPKSLYDSLQEYKTIRGTIPDCMPLPNREHLSTHVTNQVLSIQPFPHTHVII